MITSQKHSELTNNDSQCLIQTILSKNNNIHSQFKYPAKNVPKRPQRGWQPYVNRSYPVLMSGPIPIALAPKIIHREGHRRFPTTLLLLENSFPCYFIVMYRLVEIHVDLFPYRNNDSLGSSSTL